MITIFIIFVRALILYIIVIFAIRLMGKRQLGELQPAELVTTILISNIASIPIEDTSMPMVMGIFPILTLISLDVIMSTICMKSKTIRRLVSGSPKIVIYDGKIDQKMMKNLRLTVDDLIESLREQAIFDIKEVQYAIMETTGNVSVMKKAEFENATVEDLGVKKLAKNPPQLLVDDGYILKESMQKVGITEEKVKKIFSENNTSLKEVFLLLSNESGEYTLIKKEKKK